MYNSYASACLTLLTLSACGGSTTTVNCGVGTMIVNGQCVALETTGGSGGGGSSFDDAAGGAGGGGPNATGGSIANGGSGVGGGGGGVIVGDGGKPSADFCAGRDIMAIGSPGLLDDFEDGNVHVLANDGRKGDWNIHGDGCTGAMPSMSEGPPTGTGTVNSSKIALAASETGCKTANLGAPFNGYGDGVNGGSCAYDASAYDGMYFWAVGAGVRLNVQVGLRTTISEKYGGDGSCAKDAMDNGCYDLHAVPMVLTGEWKEYSFTWSQLHQAGWGTKAAWDPKITTELAIMASSNDSAVTTIEFSIDNVGFFKGAAPTDPPMPGR